VSQVKRGLLYAMKSLHHELEGCRLENLALTGSYSGQTFDFAILTTISRRLPSKFETRTIHNPRTLLPITSCNLPPRRKCLTYLPVRN
jgi:hypothetical protein